MLFLLVTGIAEDVPFVVLVVTRLQGLPTVGALEAEPVVGGVVEASHLLSVVHSLAAAGAGPWHSGYKIILEIREVFKAA